MYGLKKAPRSWYSRFHRYLQQQGFRKGNAYNNLYIKVDRDNILIIEVYVDDIIFGINDDMMSQKISKDMENAFEIYLLGELTFFLGLQICQRDKGIFISQTNYITEMINKFEMEEYKPVSTRIQTNCKLREEDESKDEDQILYISMINILLYVMCQDRM